MKIAFVVPWYGKTIPGGAETECRRTAENLSKKGVEVEVLTTCLRELESDWNQNFYPEGGYLINGITVRRFPVRKRNGEVFNQINEKLMNKLAVSPEEERLYMREMINSKDLYDYIYKNQENYLFIFIPYLFSTTYFGTAICPERSFIIPCLHDESYARMSIMRDMFTRVKGIVFNSKAEMKLAERFYGIEMKKSLLTGLGIDTNINFSSSRFKEKYKLDGRFILYAGRRDAGKNTPMLIEYFGRFKTEHDNDLKLVLIGNVAIDIPERFKEWIVDLGFVPLQDKYDAYAAATIFCQPSINESFSIVIMEAWLCGTPVVVNADCAVTKEHCLRSQGGLYFKNYPEFREIINLLLRDGNLRNVMAQRGRKYVLENYNWDKICDKYVKDILEGESISYSKHDYSNKTRGKEKRRKDSRIEVHQMLPVFSYGDAIGNNVLAIQKILKSMGFNSYVYADLVDQRLERYYKPYKEYLEISEGKNILIYHYSLFSELCNFIKDLPDEKIMIYHNVTPDFFYKDVSDEVEENCRKGRDELINLKGVFKLALGVSEYNRQELKEVGFLNTDVLPYIVDFKKYNIDTNHKNPVIKDNYIKILHVGRIAPNKKIEDLLTVFYFYHRINSNSQLFLIGTNNDTARYWNGLKGIVKELNLEEVYFLGLVSFEELVTFYRESDIYLSMSEHEGFCVPLLESMYFDLPILAYNSTAVPYTLGGAGILINKKSHHEIAEMIHLVTTDKKFKEKIIKGQRSRLKDFHIDVIKEQLRQHIQFLINRRDYAITYRS